MPAGLSLRATVLGAVTGFFPIGWIVLNVIFLYRLTVATGTFETLQTTIGGVTNDRRIQLLLIAFSFWCFFRRCIGLRHACRRHRRDPDRAWLLAARGIGHSLIANTAPVAFGALGATSRSRDCPT